MIMEGKQHVGATAYPAVATITMLMLVIVVGCIEEPPSYDSSASHAPGNMPAVTLDNQAENAQNDDAAPAESKPAKPQSKKPVKALTTNTRIVDKTFDDLNFDIEPDAPFDQSMLTEEIDELVDKRIRIRGYILPTFQRSGLKQFVLVRDNMECCFGPGAALYDCIIVDMLPGKSADFSVKPVAVEGQFTIDEFIGPDGTHLAIFHMDAEKVK